MAASGSDTWQVVLDILAYGWTYPKVTRVTTRRVTRGMDDVAGMTWQVTEVRCGMTWKSLLAGSE